MVDIQLFLINAGNSKMFKEAKQREITLTNRAIDFGCVIVEQGVGGDLK